ncbi:hypothetical protein SETIT_1G262300v2 [Setaria italica]|uniref:Uncharacterized protein n=1 Tax=Setaria italica TaxID=4555 RepID=A0A368PPV5_SETIT|nr:uncharacterized protein LOC101785294 [Setaria italica]RCV07653.1 hypothetical protein SETIT_1G262300v2 [Setaria italica]
MPEKPPLPRRRATAAGSWVRSLHCKSMAADDVAARVAVAPKKLHHPLLPRAGCGSSGDALSHVAPSKPAGRPRPKPGSSKPSPEPGKKTKPKPASVVVPPSPPPGPLGPVPALTELPAGHSSRQVVEIIFLSSWSPLPVPVPQPLPPPQPGAPTTSSSGSGSGAFPGVVEMLFRVHNPARAVTRFEDYRAAVRARAGGAARSAADGNEMMRFSPAPPYGSSPSASTPSGGGGGEDAPRIRTFDGSGGAHAAGGRGPATGRRAMFLCRVIAGRVAEAGAGSKPKEHFDSVRVGKGGELVVFDRHAVLPCFLIIYRL